MVADAIFKVCIFGDGGVGKTTLVTRYLTGIFNAGTTITIGMDFHIKKIEIDGMNIILQIWDFAGEERFRFFLPTYVRGAAGGIFMYDITRFSSFKNTMQWLNVFRKGAENEPNPIPLIMVGSKLDLEHKRVIEKDYAIETSNEHGFKDYIESSAMTGENIEIIFEKITRIMLGQTEI